MTKYEAISQVITQEDTDMATEAETFFRRIARGIGRFVRRAAPILRSAVRAIPTIVRRTVASLSRLLNRQKQ